MADTAATAATRLVLVRHGESQAAVNQVVGGHAGCKGLTPLGRDQAALLRDRLARTGELAGATALYASVLPRAIETAEIIAPAVGPGDLAVKQECGVCETHPGEGDGLGWQEFSDRFGNPWGQWFRPFAPGAESWASFMARAGEALHDIARTHAGETVVVACHGGVIEASLVAFGQLPMAGPTEWRVDYTSLTEWVLADGERDTKRWRLYRFNDTAHLLPSAFS
jgi:probable phosphoglycerate mutase